MYIFEFKARCDDFTHIREELLARQAVFAGLDEQTDTYFRVPNGRLKLREGTIERNLIHYHRADGAGIKRSDVTLYTPPPGDALKDMLVKALGVRVVVHKKREIYFIGNVKVHLDQVEGLGSFVEVEVINKDDSLTPEATQAMCREYFAAFRLRDEDTVAVSYCDLIEARG
jgi:adenylate cyclase, class 2